MFFPWAGGRLVFLGGVKLIFAYWKWPSFKYVFYSIISFNFDFVSRNDHFPLTRLCTNFPPHFSSKAISFTSLPFSPTIRWSKSLFSSIFSIKFDSFLHLSKMASNTPVLPLLTPYKLGNFNLSHRYFIVYIMGFSSSV